MALRAAAIILLFSLLLVFFAPAAVGPFSAVYGPATALRAHRAALVFYFNLALAARSPVAAMMFSLDGNHRPGALSFFIESDASAPLSAMRC